MHDSLNLDPVRVANAIAGRLAGCVPSGFDVRAQEAIVGLVVRDTWSGGTDLRGWVKPTSDRQDIERAAAAILDGVQDQIIRETGRTWPGASGGTSMPSADARLTDKELYLWYGAERAPELQFSPIRLSDLRVRENQTDSP